MSNLAYSLRDARYSLRLFRNISHPRAQWSVHLLTRSSSICLFRFTFTRFRASFLDNFIKYYTYVIIYLVFFRYFSSLESLLIPRLSLDNVNNMYRLRLLLLLTFTMCVCVAYFIIIYKLFPPPPPPRVIYL